MSRQSAFQLVIFDFDGVVVDSEIIALAELRKILAGCGVSISLEETRDRFLGTSISTPMAFIEERTSLPCPPDFVDEWHRLLFARYESELSVLPGIRELLSRLNDRSIEFCIASGGSRKRLAHALDCVDLTVAFGDRAFSTDLVKTGKPAPDIFLYAARQFGVAAKDCVVVEDAPAGITAASSAAMYPVGFVGGTHVRPTAEHHADTLSRCGARAIIKNHSELDAILNDAALAD